MGHTTRRSLPLIDRHGRVHKSLRVSLTDRCNLRCSYCMPAEGLAWLPTSELLTDDEVVRLVRVAVNAGVREVRFTGGEPTLRPGLIDIVAGCAALSPRPELALTTNGIGLDRLAAPLRAAGLDRVNVSLDSIDRTTFTTMARRDRLDEVLAGLAAARAAGLAPVKINSVLMRGVNADQGPDLLRFAMAGGYELRFIEQMPLDAQHAWRRADMITADEILALLRVHWRITPVADARGQAPAELFVVDDGPHHVGVIASVTQPFCANCDRLRLTADGQLRNCLFARTEADLRGPLRAGASDDELADRMAAAVLPKAAAHGIGDVGFVQPARPMSSIGG